MYAFRVMVTTLILILIGMIASSSVKATGSARNISVAMIVIEMLSLVAIWG